MVKDLALAAKISYVRLLLRKLADDIGDHALSHPYGSTRDTMNELSDETSRFEAQLTEAEKLILGS